MPAETRDPGWSWPCRWFAEAARLEAEGHYDQATYAEQVAMGGVQGSYEYIALTERDTEPRP